MRQEQEGQNTHFENLSFSLAQKHYQVQNPICTFAHTLYGHSLIHLGRA